MIRRSTLDALWARFKEEAHYYMYGLYQEIANKNLFLWAQAIAFKVLVTIVPVVVLATGIIAQVLRSAEPFARVAAVVRDFVPPSQSQQIISFLRELYNASSTLTLFGALGLFLSAWSLFITLRIAVSNAFERDWHVGRSLIGGYLFDVRMVLQVGLLFALTIGLSVFAQSLESLAFVRWLGLDASWLQRGWQRALRIAGLLGPFLITIAMFYQLLYFVPNPHPRKRSALIGAFITATLWEGAKQGFTYYATYVGHFDRYQSGSEMAALGNVFGIIIAFVFWVYFSAIVLMVGAVIASLHAHRYHIKEQSAEDAASESALPPPEAPSAVSKSTLPDVPAASSSQEMDETTATEGASARSQQS